jgi:hypothetical protein
MKKQLIRVRLVIERTFWIVALAVLSAFFIERIQLQFVDSYATWELSRALRELPGSGAMAVRRASAIEGQAIGRLEIPFPEPICREGTVMV